MVAGLALELAEDLALVVGLALVPVLAAVLEQAVELGQLVLEPAVALERLVLGLVVVPELEPAVELVDYP